MNVFHVLAGAQGAARLVRDDEDRIDLVRRLATAATERLLAYCIMDTHLHAVIEGSKEETTEAVAAALRAFARAFNARHGAESVLRGAVTALEIPSPAELARTIRYDHENPVRTKTPIVAEDFAFEWSSARAFRGLTRVGYVNVARTRELLGDQLPRALVRPVPLTDLEPVRVPGATPGLIAAAVGQTFGALGSELATERLGAFRAARTVYVALGRLESYSDGTLAPLIGRSRPQTSRLGSGPLDVEGMRIARTLLRTPALRARLAPVALDGSPALSATGPAAVR